jgi:hypothetical protein
LPRVLGLFVRALAPFEAIYLPCKCCHHLLAK